ncbi:hypothetical protein Taro_010808, partial [Colocasia esculenta]|nr:hypothetical protein [Colocasia esculenta]
MSPIAFSYFVFPLISHQISCFLIPSCYGEQRTKCKRFLHLSGTRFFLFLFLTSPQIYDHILLNCSYLFIPSICSRLPVIVIRFPNHSHEQSLFFLWFFTSYYYSFYTSRYLVRNHCLIPFSSIIEFAISVA